MEARAPSAGATGTRWRLWALGADPRCSRVVVGAVRLERLVARRSDRPQPAAGGRRSTSAASSSSPGEIRIHVTNPQTDDHDRLRHRRRRDRPVHASTGRARCSGSARAPIVVPYDWVADEPITVGVTSSTGIETTKEIAAAVETPTRVGAGLSRLRADRLPRRHRPGRARPALAAVAAARASPVARRLHGADRRTAVLPRRRGALPRRSTGRPRSRAGSAAPVSSCSASPQLPRHDVSLEPPARPAGARPAGLCSRCSSRSASASTTSAKGSRSAAPSPFGELQLGTLPDRRLHDPQRHRRPRHRRSGRRGQQRVRLSPPRSARARSPAAPPSPAPGSAATSRATCSACSSSPLAAGAALQVVVEVGRFVARRRPGGLTLRLRGRRLPGRDRGDVRHRPLRRLSPRTRFGRRQWRACDGAASAAAVSATLAAPGLSRLP